MAVLFSTLLAAGALAGPAGGPAALGRLRATIARAPLIGMSENEAAKDDKRIGVGIIGAGRIGLVHLEALSSCPAARPVIISNPTISKAQAAAATYPGMAWTDSDMDVILHPDVDAVWICSPSQFHAQQITACAMAGKDIFCEKPIGKGARCDLILHAALFGKPLVFASLRRPSSSFPRVVMATPHPILFIRSRACPRSDRALGDDQGREPLP